MSLKCARFRTVTHRQPGGTDYRAELAPGDPRLLYEAVRKLQTGHKHEFTHSMMGDKCPTEAIRARGQGIVPYVSHAHARTFLGAGASRKGAAPCHWVSGLPPGSLCAGER